MKDKFKAVYLVRHAFDTDSEHHVADVEVVGLADSLEEAKGLVAQEYKGEEPIEYSTCNTHNGLQFVYSPNPSGDVVNCYSIDLVPLNIRWTPFVSLKVEA